MGTRRYSCVIVRGGFGGRYSEEFEFESVNRAGSKANAEDALGQWRRKHGKSGWAEVVRGTARKIG